MWWIVAAIVFLLYMGDGNPVDGISDVISRITRGARLTHTATDSDGGVTTSPNDIADQMGATLDEAALARMIASEANATEGNLARAARACAALNMAASVGQSIFQLLTSANDLNAAKRGRFGTQPGRYASTRNDAYAGDLEIARGVLSGAIADMTAGATHFDNPGGESDPAAIAANRGASGLALRNVDGIDPSFLRFWGPG